MVISPKKCRKSNIDVVRIKNSDLLWMKLNDVQKGLGVKNISDLIIKEIKGIFNNRNLEEDQIKNTNFL